MSENIENQNPKKGFGIWKILAIALASIILFCIGFYFIVIVPATDSFASRSRDTNRQSSLRLISLGLMGYYVDNEKYPAEISSGCLTMTGLKGYFTTIPKEPLLNHKNDGCDDMNAEIPFAYRVFKNAKNEDEYIISATMENGEYGNSSHTIDEIVKNPELLKNLQKWNGKYYIVSSVY